MPDNTTAWEGALAAALPSAIALVTLGVNYAITKKIDPEAVRAALAQQHAATRAALDALDAEVAETRAKDDAG